MVSPGFAKILKYGCSAAIALAAAFLAAIVLSNPAAADPNGGGGGDVSLKSWDTDNLRFDIGATSYTAQSFAIPHYSSTQDAANIRPGNIEIGASSTHASNVSPCQSGVMDGFFQNLASQPRNGLPVLEKNSGVWEETPGHSCTGFAAAQERAVSDFLAGLYWLDSGGNLRSGGFGWWMWPGRSASPLRGGGVIYDLGGQRRRLFRGQRRGRQTDPGSRARCGRRRLHSQNRLPPGNIARNGRQDCRRSVIRSVSAFP